MNRYGVPGIVSMVSEPVAVYNAGDADFREIMNMLKQYLPRSEERCVKDI